MYLLLLRLFTHIELCAAQICPRLFIFMFPAYSFPICLCRKFSICSTAVYYYPAFPFSFLEPYLHQYLSSCCQTAAALEVRHGTSVEACAFCKCAAEPLERTPCLKHHCIQGWARSPKLSPSWIYPSGNTCFPALFMLPCVHNLAFSSAPSFLLGSKLSKELDNQ